MQRDIGNEVIVAIIVVGVLAFALTFGIILSLSNSGVSNPSIAQSTIATGTEGTGTQDVTAEVTDEANAVALAASATAADLPDVTRTARPSSTSTSTQTATHEPSDTPTLTATNTPRPTETQTRRPTLTATMTATHTATHTPTRTPTASPTLTQTPTLTNTPTSTLTRTSTPSPTPTLTRTSTSIPTPLNTATPAICVAPFGWLIYNVQPGNTLANIADASGTTPADLRAANCLPDSATVRIGDSLYVPRLPLFVTPLPTALPDAILVAQGCTNPGTVVTSPVSGQAVTGTILIRGTAYSEDFAYYRIEARPDTSDVYNFLLRSNEPVVNGNLGIIDSRSLSRGLNWLRVSVVDTAGNVAITPCAIPVIIQ